MKVVILYRPDAEFSREVETFVHDFKARNTSVHVELMNVDERDGIALASLYDIMRFPAILALAGDGGLLKYWEGPVMPLMDEVASYAYAG
jgi:hypothetical protein